MVGGRGRRRVAHSALAQLVARTRDPNGRRRRHDRTRPSHSAPILNGGVCAGPPRPPPPQQHRAASTTRALFMDGAHTHGRTAQHKGQWRRRTRPALRDPAKLLQASARRRGIAPPLRATGLSDPPRSSTPHERGTHPEDLRCLAPSPVPCHLSSHLACTVGPRRLPLDRPPDISPVVLPSHPSGGVRPSHPRAERREFSRDRRFGRSRFPLDWSPVTARTDPTKQGRCGGSGGGSGGIGRQIRHVRATEGQAPPLDRRHGQERGGDRAVAARPSTSAARCHAQPT